MGTFDIDIIISAIGETITVSDIAVASTTDRGAETITTTDYSVKAYVEPVGGAEEFTKSGKVIKADIFVVVDEDETYASQLVEKNRITYGSIVYEIVGVEHLKGHYEVYASRL